VLRIVFAFIGKCKERSLSFTAALVIISQNMTAVGYHTCSNYDVRCKKTLQLSRLFKNIIRMSKLYFRQ